MAIKNKTQSVVKNDVTLGQLIGVALTLLILIATSYVNLQIKVSQGEIRQTNTDLTLGEIKSSVKDVQTTQNIILQKLGAMEAKVEDARRTAAEIKDNK